MSKIQHVHSENGFTLIELMITIAIVAILVALAVPAYNTYAVRAKIAECINSASVAKVQISEYRQTLGPWPPTQSDAGLDNSSLSQFCDGIDNYSAANGSFSVGVDEASVDPGLSGVIAPLLTPEQTNTGIINWNCSSGTTDAGNVKYLPATCRDT